MNKISDLQGAPYNPRKITDAQLKALAKSMKEFGDLSGIVRNRRSGHLVGGHQRVKLLDPAWPVVSVPHDDQVGTVALGYIDTPHGRWTYREVDWPEKKEQAANIAANKHGGDWDIPKLKELLLGLDDGAFDLGLTGFTDREIKELIDWEGKAGLTDPDHAPDVLAESITRPGDLWTLGAHRLLCGDSTTPESLARLLGDGKADMVFTDPPYGIDYVPEELKRCSRRRTGHVLGGIEGDQTTFKQSPWLDNVSAYYSGAIYICGCPQMYPEVWAWLLSATKREPTIIVWSKNNFSIGRRDYHRKHEFIFNDEGNAGIEDLENVQALSDGRLVFYSWNARRTWLGKRKECDVWEEAREATATYRHPTQKPVALIARALLNSSEPGALVLDPFLGSGSTLIACQQLARRCVGLEIDPKYCDVIVRRWEEFTGKKATRA